MKLRRTASHNQLDLRVFRNRLAVGGLFVLLLFSVLIARFVYLQIYRHDHYTTLAENNRIALVPIVPNRGLILDRNGVILAHNYSAYTLEITPDKTNGVKETIEALGKILEITSKDLKRFKKLREEGKNFESIPIRTRLTEEEIARFTANRYRFPGVEIKARLFRNYPFGEIASHLIGYIGRISDKDREKIEEDDDEANYRGTDHIGKIGIEQSYEKALHGTTGAEQIEIDSGGRALRTLNRIAPKAGNNLYLSIDIELQKIAEESFKDYRGALVAIDPNNGEVLAFVSRPGFDPNLFVDGIDAQSWKELNESPDHPLTNRALRGQYPPGSTFKPFMAMAALELGKRTPYYTINDRGYYNLPGSSHRYRDWKPTGHGAVNLEKSIIISCDVYYYELAVDMGIETMHRFMSQFGFGQKTGIDLENELSGVLPNNAWKKKRFKKPWVLGETVIAGIGQGYNLATPLQLAHATAILANGGRSFRPHLVHAIQENGNHQPQIIKSQLTAEYHFKPQFVEVIKKAMLGVMRPGGTANAAGAGAPYNFAGKTGTAQVVGIKQNEKYVESKVAERHRDHALFVGFAPSESPRIAVGVMVENGGHGGSVAAPIARKVIDYLLLKKRPRDKDAEQENKVNRVRINNQNSINTNSNEPDNNTENNGDENNE